MCSSWSHAAQVGDASVGDPTLPGHVEETEARQVLQHIHAAVGELDAL